MFWSRSQWYLHRCINVPKHMELYIFKIDVAYSVQIIPHQSWFKQNKTVYQGRFLITWPTMEVSGHFFKPLKWDLRSSWKFHLLKYWSACSLHVNQSLKWRLPWRKVKGHLSSTFSDLQKMLSIHVYIERVVFENFCHRIDFLSSGNFKISHVVGIKARMWWNDSTKNKGRRLWVP